MESITHFSHEHPLIPLNLLSRVKTESKSRYCACCHRIISHEEKQSDLVYGCEFCESFFLHKSCAQLPREIVHSCHQEHSLFLLSKTPTNMYGCCRRCYEDIVNCHYFFYYCYLCHFALCIKCGYYEYEDRVLSSEKDLNFLHPSHKHHPLTVHPRPSSFLCDACGVEDKDLVYQCSPCNYWIHKRCAILPPTTTLDIHSHPLTLAFGLPSQYHTFQYYCDICGLDINKWVAIWLYYCYFCRYFVHIRCRETKKPEIKEVDLKGLSIDDLPRLPTNNIYVELIRPFFLKNCLSSHSNIEQEITIFSHKHPLAYSNEQIIEVVDDLEDGEEILCDACIEPIFSPPYYHCGECNYFLHLTCAKLPQQLERPSINQHPLILKSKPRFDEAFRCNYCQRKSNGFFFYTTTKGYEFYIDIKCATLPNILQHEYHNHPLFKIALRRYDPNLIQHDLNHLQSKIALSPYDPNLIQHFDYNLPTVGYPNCRCCGDYIYTFDHDLFGCNYCKIYLHVRCLLLPKTTKHRFDYNHPLILRSPPHSYHPKPFDCAECEKEINPLYWLYHCEECDLSFHVFCAHPAWEEYNSKFGQKVKIGSHPHTLKYVYKASVRSSKCNHCEEQFEEAYFVLECETCNFRICKECVRKIFQM